jgi:molybdopterin converting factor subunit 1
MSKIRLLFFATLRDRAGMKTAEMEVPAGTTVRQLKERLAQEYPALGPSLPSALIAVNREYAAEDLVLPADADVALFPPVSGG